jgi:hypothetical protein
MTDHNLFGNWAERLKDVAGSWPAFITLGSFALYVLGYLCIRFHLTALGLGTDLNVLDERYLFAGAKFLVYLLSTLATFLFFVLLLAPIPGLIYWLIKRGKKGGTTGATDATPASSGRSGEKIAFAGIVLSLLSIQLVMKQCFLFSNLLLANNLPWTGLNFQQLLLEEGENRRALYFVGLVALTALTFLLWLYARSRVQPQNPASKFLITLLALLVGVQFLFLPVNYGVFIVEKDLPRVTGLGDGKPLPEQHDAWLVWEGNEGATFLLRHSSAGNRRLVTVPKKEVTKVEIAGYDPIFRRIFLNQ